MKKLNGKLSYALYLILVTTLFTSCGFDEYDCFKSVEEEFPNAIEIKSPVGEDYRFIVMDADSSIYYIETMNNHNTDITQKELLFK